MASKHYVETFNRLKKEVDKLYSVENPDPDSLETKIREYLVDRRITNNQCADLLARVWACRDRRR